MLLFPLSLPTPLPPLADGLSVTRVELRIHRFNTVCCARRTRVDVGRLQYPTLCCVRRAPFPSTSKSRSNQARPSAPSVAPTPERESKFKPAPAVFAEKIAECRRGALNQRCPSCARRPGHIANGSDSGTKQKRKISNNRGMDRWVFEDKHTNNRTGAADAAVLRRELVLCSCGPSLSDAVSCAAVQHTSAGKSRQAARHRRAAASLRVLLPTNTVDKTVKCGNYCSVLCSQMRA